MFKIYDTNRNFVSLIENCKNPCVTTELETGTKSLSFQLPMTDEYRALIAEEYYIEMPDYEYVVKEINMSQNNFFTVYCNPNLEDLKGNIIPAYDVIDVSIRDALQQALDIVNLPWVVVCTSTLTDIVTYAVPQATPHQIIEQIKEDYNLEIFYDTKNKKVRVYDAIGKNKGMLFMNELKLKMLTRQGHSYDFATVLYPIGKDGLTIANVNNGDPTVSNNTYCDKKITKYWIQDDIEFPEQLKMAAEAYLAYVSSPIVSYSVELCSLPADIELGDDIILVDKIKRIRQKQRVVKIINFLNSPEKDSVQLSNEIVDFAKTFTKFNSDYKKQINYIKKNLETLS